MCVEKTEDQSTWSGVVCDIPGDCKRFTVLQGDPTQVSSCAVVGVYTAALSGLNGEEGCSLSGYSR